MGDFHLDIDLKTVGERQFDSIVKENAASLGEALGGEGNPIFVGLRGFSSEHTQVIEDSVLQRDLSSPSGTLPLSELFSAPLDKVEVLYGSHTSRWGGAALGGVIHFITSNRPDHGLNLSYGSYQTAKLSGLAKLYETPNHHLSLQGGFQQSDGYSIAEGGNEKDGFIYYGGRALYSYVSQKSVLRVSSSLLHRRQSADAFGGPSGDLADYSIDTSRMKLVASFRKEISATYQFKAYSQFVLSNRLNNSPESVQSLNPKVAYAGNSVDIGYQALWQVLQGVALNHYLHYYYDGLEIKNVERSRRDHHHQGVLSAGSEVQLKWQSMLLNVGGLSSFNLQGHQGASYKVALGKKSKGRFHSRGFIKYSQGSKLPSLYQVHDMQYGNANLSEEYSRGVEVTFGIGGPLFDAQLAIYQYFLFDFIDFDAIQFRYQNLSKVRFQGLQFAGSFRPLTNNKITLNANLQATKDLRRGGQLSGRPTFDGKVSHTLQLAALTLRNSVHYTGERVGFSGENLDKYFLWNFSGGYQWRDNVDFRLVVKNLLATSYEISPGFQQPGRNWQLSLSCQM